MTTFEEYVAATPSVKAALEFATHAHEGQMRKFGDKQPFISHPLAVAKTLFEDIFTVVGENKHWQGAATAADVIAAALIHDVFEDTEATVDQAYDCGMSSLAVQIAIVLTHRKNESYTEYILRVHNEDVAAYIKIHDIKHNLLTLPKKGSLRDKYELALIYLQGL